MSVHYTDKFDSQFGQIDIYKRYPLYMPFVGVNYPTASNKILFIGESHYLPKRYDNTIGVEWYDKKLSDYDFNEEARGYLNTRDLINYDVIEGVTKNKSHSIYRNIGNTVGEVFNTGDYRESLKSIVFYNYFLRPAEVLGKSIKVNGWQETEYSMEVMEKLKQILNPTKIIFCSRLARSKFNAALSRDKYINSEPNYSILVEDIPHPGSAWWNRSAKKYGGKTGRERLLEILMRLKTS